MLTTLFEKIYHAISFTFAIVAFSLMSAWLAASYAYTFIFASIRFTDGEARYVLMILSIGLVAATLLHAVHFGLLNRIGMAGFSRNIRIVNRHLTRGTIFTIPDSREKYDKSMELLAALYSLPKLNLLYSSLYSMLFVLIAGIAYYLFSHKVRDVLLMLGSGIASCMIYGYYSLNVTEYFIGKVKVGIERSLFLDDMQFKSRTLISIKSKSVIVLVLFALNIILLTVMFRMTDDVTRQVIFITDSILIVGILIVLLVNSIEYSLKRIITSTKDLAKGGSGLYFPYFSNREFVEFSDHHNQAALEINLLRNDLRQQVDERTMELNAALEELEAINSNLVRVNTELEEAQRTADLDMTIAMNLQTSLLPGDIPADSAWDIALEYRPLSGVSGDFYDFYHDGDSLTGVSLFDVSGHGIASGLIAMISRSIIRKIIERNWDTRLTDIISEINTELSVEISHADFYLSGVMLRINGSTIEYINAAHPDIIARRGGTAKVVNPGKSRAGFKGELLGFRHMGRPGSVIKFQVEKGDMLVAYSDCLSESKDSLGEEYGEERIRAAVERSPGDGARAVLDHIMDDFQSFIGTARPRDDLTVIVIKKKE